MLEKIFKAYDVRAVYGELLNEEAAWKVGYATGSFLRSGQGSVVSGQGPLAQLTTDHPPLTTDHRPLTTPLSSVAHPHTVVVGRDMRTSSPALSASLIEGLLASGMNVVDVGMIDTSFIYFAINHEQCAGGIQVTASHNPAKYNGFKISGPFAKPIGSMTGLEEIKRIAVQLDGEKERRGEGENDSVSPSPVLPLSHSTAKKGGQASSPLTTNHSPPVAPRRGDLQHKDLWKPYRAHVLKFLDLPRKLRVIIDASNGMAGKMVPAVFSGIANLEIEPMLFEITGSFTHEPNPLVEANLHLLQQRMKQSKADLGVCFDGDADRCIFLDETGRPIGCDLITALLARDFLRQPGNRGSSIIYDLRSSHVVIDEVTAAGGIPVRERVGHAFMKKTLAETQAVFGGELSGHFYFRDNYYADSGAIAFSRLLSVLAAQDKPLSELIQPLRRYAHSGEINFQVEDKDGKITELSSAYRDARIDFLDGITIEYPDWWFNVRKSNTEPFLRLTLEARTPQMMNEKLSDLKKYLGDPVEGH